MDDFDIMDLTPVIQELHAALDGKVSEDVLRKELEKYIITYKTGITVAKESILRRYRGTKQGGTFVSSAGVTKTISELEGTEMNVNIVAKMIFVEKKEVTIKNVPKKIISGIAADDSGTAPFTIWSDAGEYQKGQVYTFKNAYTKSYRDQIQINIGLRGRVEPNDEVTFSAPASSASGAASGAAQDIAIGDITDQTKSVNVKGIVSNVQSRAISVKGEEKTVWGGIIADETGKVQFTSWNDFGLKDGETLLVRNAYIRAWKGIPQINMGDRTTVERIDEVIGEVPTGPMVKTVEEIVKVGGGLDIVITGTVVDIRNGSGLIKRCPECKRSVLGDECSIHGRIMPAMDLRLKLTVDDGTGAISAIINRGDTEKITGITLGEATALAKEKGDMGVVANRMGGALLLKKITITGNVMSDEFGPQMSVHSTEIATVDVAAEAEALYEEVEGSL